MKKLLVYFFIVLTLVNTLILIWSYYDCAPPVFDMACHLLSGFTCCDLLSHPHFRSGEWWHSLLAVNPLYPPFVYIVYGIFKLVLGPQRWVEILVHLVFSSILFSSVYGIAKLTFVRPTIALLSSLIIFIYPQVFLSSHYDLLDLPGLAMVALSLFCFIWWQKQSSIYSAISLGITCALAVLTKNNSLAFLAGPLLLAFLYHLIKQDWLKIKTLLLAGTVGVIVILPWIIFASLSMHEMISIIQKQNYETNFINSFRYYVSNLPCLPSIFLLLIFILAFCLSSKTVHRKMLYLSCSGISGIFLLSLFHWIPQSRYELPVAIPMTIYSAQACANCWSSPKMRAVLVAIAGLICFAFLQNNFSPYPLPRMALPTSFSNFMGIMPETTDFHHLPGGTAMYPTPPLDWGYQWVFKTTEPYLTTRQQHMAVLPNSEEISATTYSYLAKQNNLDQKLHIFTIRNWTMLGDEVGFNQHIASLIDWYLLKTNDQGSHLADAASQKAYTRWYSFVKTSGQFEFIGSNRLPDGSQLELYRRRN